MKAEALTAPRETRLPSVARYIRERLFPKRAVRPNDGFNDPLAVHIGLGVGAQDIPADGWPESFDKDIAVRTLGFLEGVGE